MAKAASSFEDIAPETIERALGGDEDAAREIIEKLHRPVLSTIHRFLGRGYAEEVEDIAQEIFLKVFRNLGKFDPHRGVKLTTWVFSIVRNHCFDVLKSRRPRPASLGSDDDEGRAAVPEPQDETELPPLRAALDRELGGKIEEALQRLRPAYRLVFVLREFEGLDYKTIAEVTGLEVGTVKTRLHRARGQLMRALAPYLAGRE